MDAVVPQEDSVAIRLVGFPNQVAWCYSRDLDPPAHATELPGKLSAEFRGSPPRHPDGEQVDVGLRVTSPAGGHRSIQVDRRLTGGCLRNHGHGRAHSRL